MHHETVLSDPDPEPTDSTLLVTFLCAACSAEAHVPYDCVEEMDEV